MLITEKRLRSIIKNQLLLEFVPSLLWFLRSGDDAEEMVQSMFDESSLLIGEIIIGFTPVGVAVDIKDLIVAMDNGESSDIVLGMAGLIPGVSEVKKLDKLRKIAKEGKDARAFKSAAKELNDALEVSSKTGKTIQRGSRVIKGLNKIKDEIDNLIKSDRIYHIHTTRNRNIDIIKQKGVGLKSKTSELKREPVTPATEKRDWENREFNRSTWTNEKIDHLDSKEFPALSTDDIKKAAFEGWPGTGGASFTQRYNSNKNKYNSTFIIELPPGKKLKDVVEKAFDLKSARGQSRRKSNFLAVIPPQYIRGIIDRSGDEIILEIFD